MTPPQERLFLLDGMALAYRAYFAFINRPLINSKGENTSAIYGFVTSLMKILDDERPEHIAVVFDTSTPTFRHAMYAEYKATRQKMPEDMAASLSRLKDVIRAFSIPIVEVPGYEADDVIGTIARQAEREHVMTYLVTGDKDFMQLISPLIRMYKPGKAAPDVEIVDEKGVLEKFGVTPDHVTDVLALIGDTSDNVPGVKGIGEKTAIPLIRSFGTVEALYDNLDRVPQKGVRDKLLASRESAFLSKKLVTIDIAVPLTVDFHDLRSEPTDTAAIIRLFGELEFRTLVERFRNLQFPPGPQSRTPSAHTPPPPQDDATSDDIASTRHAYARIDTPGEFEQLAGRIDRSEFFVFRTETTGQNPFDATLVGLSIALEPHAAFYIPIIQESDTPARDLFGMTDRVAASDNPPGLGLNTVLARLKPALEMPARRKVGHNLKEAALLLRRHGIRLAGPVHDTMVAAYVLRADRQHSIDALAMEYFGYRTIATDELLGKGKSAVPLTAVPPEALTRYSAERADVTLRAFRYQEDLLQKQGMEPLVREIEFPLLLVLADMEARGITVDREYLGVMSETMDLQIRHLVQAIHHDAGAEFNINSTQQLGDILFRKLGLPTVRKTKTGYSTDVGVLESLRGQHPIINHLLEYRQLTKLKSTYIDALPALIRKETGRVHTSFNQTVAATGRLSSSDPNLQNIPIRTGQGSAIRKAFVPGSADVQIISADYSQIELRIMAHVSDDQGLRDAFIAGEDIHTTTAARVFGVDTNDVTRDMRRKAKEVNFGIMYGIGPFGLATRLEIPQGEAKEIIERYFARFPRVRTYIDGTLSTARRTGFVSTLLGRRRYLPDLNSRNFNLRSNAERQAINMPIQGTAADMIKKAMIDIHRDFQEASVRGSMLLQVHDELVFEIARTDLDRARPLIVGCMQKALALSVPVDVEIGAGDNWLEAH